MATDNILRSFGDTSRKEDVVLNAIEILTAKETQIFNMLPKTSAIDTIHIYLTDELATAASSAVAESGDYSAGVLSTPTRRTNLVENVARPFKVSRTQQRIEHYHGENELQRQTRKELLNWANSAEFDLVNYCVAIWKHIVRKLSLINGRSLKWLSSTSRIISVQLQRLNEITPLRVM